MIEQISKFTDQIAQVFYSSALLKPGKNWNDTFQLLTQAILNVPKDKKIVLFLDEFPWMATKNSRLLQNLDYYWNQFWSNDKRIKLIICGSATSWIVKKIIHNKGGLHNRVTQEMYLQPFNLYNTQRFLKGIGVNLNHRHTLNIYMAMGGIPYYLRRIERGLSSSEIIQQLAFNKNSFLFDEFDKLFSSLYGDHQEYVDIIKLIASHRYGVSQEKIFKKISGISKGENGLDKLDDLEKNGFIASFIPFGRKKGTYYKVVDEYVMFYSNWLAPIKSSLLSRAMRKGYWEKQMTSAAWHSWAGYAFESICYKHINQVSYALGLSPTSIPHAWQHVSKKYTDDAGAQIDLLFDRDDDAITLCEIKHTNSPFALDKAYAKILQNKIDVFKKHTKTDKQIFLAIVSANGLKKTLYSEEIIDATVSLIDLFSKDE